MSGHSKWSTIKRKKGAADSRRGKVFSKIIKELTVAAKDGGGDPDTNAKLRAVIDKAKATNMPNDNIDRAIKRGTGEIEGITYESSTYEGYGPNGVAILVETLTDNKNRTVAEIRHIFSKAGGSLGEAGCVAWMFKRKGVMVFDKDKVDTNKLMDAAIETGAEDIRDSDETLDIYTNPDDFSAVRDNLMSAGFTPAEADIQSIPQSTVKLDGDDAARMLKLMESLEDHDDVQDVSANFDIDTDVMEKELG